VTEVSSTGWRSFAINSGPLSERINSGAPCSAMAARTKLMDVGGADAPLGPQDVNLFRVLVEHGEHPQGPADVIPEIRAA